MERAAEHFATQPEAAREAFAAAFAFLESSGVLHTQDEEESVFPRLRPVLDGEGRHYLDELEREHAEAERLYRELREAVAAGAGIAEAVAPLTQLYRRHIASEDVALQRHAQAFLTAGQLAAIAAEMKQRRGV
jgi:hemerythrin-like domain-containing protein